MRWLTGSAKPGRAINLAPSTERSKEFQPKFPRNISLNSSLISHFLCAAGINETQSNQEEPKMIETSTGSQAPISDERRIGRFFIRQELFTQVKEHMGIELERAVSDQEAEDFLARHPPLLGSIVGYDEVDTEDRSRIWEYCCAERKRFF